MLRHAQHGLFSVAPSIASSLELMGAKEGLRPMMQIKKTAEEQTRHVARQPASTNDTSVIGVSRSPKADPAARVSWVDAREAGAGETPTT